MSPGRFSCVHAGANEVVLEESWATTKREGDSVANEANPPVIFEAV